MIGYLFFIGSTSRMRFSLISAVAKEFGERDQQNAPLKVWNLLITVIK